MAEKYAVIQMGGKQFKITEGSKVELESQDKLDIDVLLFSDGKTIEIGDPVLKGFEVKAKIIENKKAPKIRVARFRSKSRHRRVQGHKQPMSVVEIESLGKKTTKTAEKKETKVEKKPTTKKATTKKTPSKKVTKKEAK